MNTTTIDNERRTQERIAFVVPVTCYSGSRPVTWRAQDIATGGGGIFVTADELLERGAEVTIGFYAPGYNVEIVTDAVVAWVNEPQKPGNDPSKLRGMGLKFPDLDPEYLKVLQQYVEVRKKMDADLADLEKDLKIPAAPAETQGAEQVSTPEPSSLPELPPLPPPPPAGAAKPEAVTKPLPVMPIEPLPVPTAPPVAPKIATKPTAPGLVDDMIRESLFEIEGLPPAEAPWPEAVAPTPDAPPAKIAAPVKDPLAGVEAVETPTPDQLAALERLADGTTLGSYSIRKWLGSGGMGDVYLAEHTQLGRQVAIKRLRSEWARNRRGLKRFFDEARAVNRIEHENIVQITDFAIEEQHVYCVMEFLEGQTLAEVQTKLGRVPVARALHIAIQVCDALDVCHRAGIIHRDLKPQNIMLVKRGAREDFVKLLDFGVAKLKEPEGALSPESTGNALLGTPGYMSPEQLLGNPVDQRADIYALGVILYQMITGTNPFLADTWGQAVVKHATYNPPKPSEVEGTPKKLPVELEKLILACLQKDRANRPPSTNAVALRLRQITGELPALERDALQAALGATPTRRRGPSLALGFGVGVIVVALATGAVVLWGPRVPWLPSPRASDGPAALKTGETAAAKPEPATNDAKQAASPVAVALRPPAAATGIPPSATAASAPSDVSTPTDDPAAKGTKGKTKGRPGATTPTTAPIRSEPSPAAAATRPTAALSKVKPSEPAATPAKAPPKAELPPKPEPASTAATPSPPPEAGTPHPAEAAFEQGRELLKDNKAELAIQQFEKCVAINPKHAGAYRLMGKAYAALGREAKAIEAFEKFVELAPDHKDAEKLRKIIEEYRKR